MFYFYREPAQDTMNKDLLRGATLKLIVYNSVPGDLTGSKLSQTILRHRNDVFIAKKKYKKKKKIQHILFYINQRQISFSKNILQQLIFLLTFRKIVQGLQCCIACSFQSLVCAQCQHLVHVFQYLYNIFLCLVAYRFSSEYYCRIRVSQLLAILQRNLKSNM